VLTTSSIAIPIVLTQHHQKIHLEREYPCPCHVKGKLQQIVLTEALACERCRRIFVVQADGYSIEELAASYPYKRRYAWNGARWQILRSFPGSVMWGLFQPQHGWVLWLQSLSILALLMAFLRLCYHAIAFSPILNLVSSMAIAIFLAIVVMLWLFSQG
jgi:hypothetical protein